MIHAVAVWMYLAGVPMAWVIFEDARLTPMTRLMAGVAWPIMIPVAFGIGFVVQIASKLKQ